MEKYDVIVAGAGASGLMAAVAAARSGAAVLTIDGNDRVGRKIYATGNGRCNFTNRLCGSGDFNASSDGFVSSVLQQFSAEDTVSFFHDAGMLAREEDSGRCYPYSGQATAVVSAFMKMANEQNVRLHLEDRIVSTHKNDRMYRIMCESGIEFESKALVIACGGRAGLKFGSTGDGYGFAKAFGHTLAPPRPGLVAVESEDFFMSDLKGVRAKAKVSLTENGKLLAEESGEVQFTGTGISGICVFDLSRYMEAPRPVKKKKKNRSAGEKERPSVNYMIKVDFAPDQSEDSLKALIGEPSDKDSLQDAISGIVNTRLAAVAANLAWTESQMRKSLNQAVDILKGMQIHVAGTKGWDDAQVTCGGIKRNEITAETMESKLTSGLFFCGEVADVDGRCGGYNLQWAWASGYVAGKNAAGASRKI